MQPVNIKIVKELIVFDKDGETKKLGGIRVILGPKCEKFIMLKDEVSGRSSNLDLLNYTNPSLYQWFNNNSYGADLTLAENYNVNSFDGVYKQDANANML